LLHDIRRQDDKRDATHGGRTAHWLGQNAAAIQKEWRITITNEDIRAMAAIIALHESPYTDLTDEELTTYQKYTQETDILKTADALDRYRMPKLKWWPNDAYLRLLPPAWLKQTAYETVLKSETLFLKNNDSLTSVWEVVKSNATQ